MQVEEIKTSVSGSSQEVGINPQHSVFCQKKVNKLQVTTGKNPIQKAAKKRKIW